MTINDVWLPKCSYTTRIAFVTALTCLVLPLPKSAGQDSASTPQQQSSSAVSAPNDSTVNQTVVKMDPFEIYASANVGYGSQVSRSSSRLNLPYIDVPQTVSVITSEFLKDAFIFDSHDTMKYVNDVYPRTNAHQSEYYFIRGLEITQTYVDGFVTSYAVNRDTALYDRIEVVKGPASAAMGRGEAGGLVNFVGKMPLPGNRDTFNVIVGSDSFYRAELDHNGRLTADGRMSYRIPAYYEDADGTRNPHNLMHVKKYGVGPSFLWRISDNTEIAATADLFRYQGPGVVGETWWSNPDILKYQLQLGWVPADSPWNPLAGKGHFVSPDRVYGYPSKGRVTDTGEVSAIITHKFSDNLSVRQGIRYDDINEHYESYNLDSVLSVDPANPSDFLIPVAYLNDVIKTQGIRAQGDVLFTKKIGSSSHQLLVGYDAYSDSMTYKDGSISGLTQDLYNPSYAFPAGFNTETAVTTYTTDLRLKDHGFAYYGQYSGSFFRDKILVMANWRKDSNVATTYDNNYSTFTSTGKQVTSVPRYSITYKPTNAIAIYYVKSKQADPVSPPQNTYRNFQLSDENATLPPLSDPRRSELITSQVKATLDEVGVKANLDDNRITASFSVFEINRQGFILNEVVYDPAGYNYDKFYIVSGENVRGFEAELFGQPTKELTVYAGYSNESGSKPKSSGEIVSIESLIDSITVHLKYDFRDSNRNGFEVTLGGKYWFKGWVMWPGSTVLFSNDQKSMDVGASYSWGKGRYGVGLKVNNLTNKVVYITPNSQWAPRRVFLSFSAGF